MSPVYPYVSISGIVPYARGDSLVRYRQPKEGGLRFFIARQVINEMYTKP